MVIDFSRLGERLTQRSRRRYFWHSWYAWYPVRLNTAGGNSGSFGVHYAWLERLERIALTDERYAYRLPRFKLDWA